MTARVGLWAVNLLGAAAFVWPLLLSPERGGEAAAHAADAPLLVLIAVPLLAVVAVAEARRGGDARTLALLAALAAVTAVLRIPKGPSGEGFALVLPILAGWTMGARFALVLGALAMLVSAVITGGVGPWLPFQMFALGWVGAGAALVRRAVGGRAPAVSLGAYALVASIGYGVVMTLWFWPFLGRDGGLFFSPGLGLAETVRRYTAFYALSSFPWDVGRALLGTVPLVVILARPVTELLERVRLRLGAEIVTDGSSEASVPSAAGLDIARPAQEA